MSVLSLTFKRTSSFHLALSNPKALSENSIFPAGKITWRVPKTRRKRCPVKPNLPATLVQAPGMWVKSPWSPQSNLAASWIPPTDFKWRVEHKKCLADPFLNSNLPSHETEHSSYCFKPLNFRIIFYIAIDKSFTKDVTVSGFSQMEEHVFRSNLDNLVYTYIFTTGCRKRLPRKWIPILIDTSNSHIVMYLKLPGKLFKIPVSRPSNNSDSVSPIWALGNCILRNTQVIQTPVVPRTRMKKHSVKQAEMAQLWSKPPEREREGEMGALT